MVYQTVTRWAAFVSVGVGASQRIPLSVLARNLHKRLAREISHRKKTRKGRSLGEQKKAVNRREQNRPVGRREQELGPVDSEAGLANVRGWVSVPPGFAGISLEYTLALGHRCTGSYAKVSQTSPFLHLELTQVLVCLFSFLPHSWLCMLCFVCP